MVTHIKLMVNRGIMGYMDKKGNISNMGTICYIGKIGNKGNIGNIGHVTYFADTALVAIFRYCCCTLSPSKFKIKQIIGHFCGNKNE